MKYCAECGNKVTKKVPENDTVLRFVCESCNKIHYQNPTVIAGCIADWQGKVLLCQRAIAPHIGSWTLPAGFMEYDEAIEQAAVREAYEETGAKISIDSLYAVFHVEQMNQVYIIYRGTLDSPEYHAGIESMDVKLFEPADIPWDQLFYPAIRDILQRFKMDLERGISSVYSGSAVHGKVMVVDRNFTS
ncbi:NUDIX hydrolase [Dasania marina]|uniref:NUDIX hydrolase n=1 Tax=Dasania marina TaxID=471499 RepID=UPI0004776160|nr:NUDIX hydrolase [Dasania marina]